MLDSIISLYKSNLNIFWCYYFTIEPTEYFILKSIKNMKVINFNVIYLSFTSSNYVIIINSIGCSSLNFVFLIMVIIKINHFIDEKYSIKKYLFNVRINYMKRV